MFLVPKQGRWKLPVALLSLLLLLAGCGGAESRKAKHLEKGKEFLAAGNLDKARVEFSNALQIAPNDSAARYENGVVAERMGSVRQAVGFYQGALRATPRISRRARASVESTCSPVRHSRRWTRLPLVC